ncbi:ciliary microtubule inner protein 5 isoform X2 [Paroedura picta]|uniref:ciliary microtubule inner protein 5 isoform X2 n=1 Tax=Paroedura picta TaxID=143630 RepID=UPI00405636A0
MEQKLQFLEHGFRAYYRQPRSQNYHPQTRRSTPATLSLEKQLSRIQGEQQRAWKGDQVQQDKVWREFVDAERRSTKNWYRNWNFLKDYDPMGKKKEHKQPPEYVSVFSDQIPNTNGHIIGRQMNTELGKTLVKMDYFFNYGRRKNKLGQELQLS